MIYYSEINPTNSSRIFGIPLLPIDSDVNVSESSHVVNDVVNDV